MFKIEYGIPLTGRKNGRKAKYPFADMNVGDSFALPAKNVKSARSRAFQINKKMGFKFAFRTFNDKVRCWRVA